MYGRTGSWACGRAARPEAGSGVRGTAAVTAVAAEVNRAAATYTEGRPERRGTSDEDAVTGARRSGETRVHAHQRDGSLPTPCARPGSGAEDVVQVGVGEQAVRVQAVAQRPEVGEARVHA